VAPRDRPTRGHLYVKVKVARLLLGAPSLALIIILLLSAAVVKEISYILTRLLLLITPSHQQPGYHQLPAWFHVWESPHACWNLGC
jgi:hypothetical protein